MKGKLKVQAKKGIDGVDVDNAIYFECLMGS